MCVSAVCKIPQTARNVLFLVHVNGQRRVKSGYVGHPRVKVGVESQGCGRKRMRRGGRETDTMVDVCRQVVICKTALMNM